MEHRRPVSPLPFESPSPRSRAVLRSLTAALAVAALGAATGCGSWQSIRAMGVPGEKLDKVLQGQEMRYQGEDGLVETKVLEAKTPYVEIPGKRDPETGKKTRDVLDLRFLDHPEVKVPNREGKIVAIVAGSSAGAVLIGVVIAVLVTSAKQFGGSLSGSGKPGY